MNLSPKKTPRLLRLLPSVVVVGTGLLVLNASGLIHDAYAGINMPGADALRTTRAAAASWMSAAVWATRMTPYRRGTQRRQSNRIRSIF